MSIYEAARALDLECVLVPIISLASYHDEDTEHLFTKNFYPFNGGRTGDYEHPTDGWGTNMSRSRIVWLNKQPGVKRSEKNDKDKTEEEKAEENAKDAADTKEVQLAYMTVSLILLVILVAPNADMSTRSMATNPTSTSTTLELLCSFVARSRMIVAV